MAGTSETPEGSPASPDDINSRLAEIAAELASEARFKEPSAAERARARVTAVRPAARPVRRGPLRRWRSWRARRQAEELRSPVRQAGGPAPAPQRRPSRMARRAARRQAVPDRGYADATLPSRLRSGTTIVIIMVLLIGVSVGLRYAIRHYSPAATGGAPRDTPTAVLSDTPPLATPTAATGPQQTFIPAAPFQGSPAESYASGTLGIRAPRATRLGQFSAAEVTAAYATTRKLLIAGYLDRPTLAGGRPTAFASLLDTRERAMFLRDLTRAGLSRTGQPLSSRDWVTSFAPGSGAELLGKVIKVHGQMTAATAQDHGTTVLRIRTDYLFVYPVTERGDLESGLRVVNRVVMTVYFAPFNEPASSALVAHVQSITGGPTGVQCGTHDGYVHPAFAGLPGPSAQPTGTPIDPYDQNTPPPANPGCAPTTGT